MSVIESIAADVQYPELAGARVLITGLESGHGVDIARAFAENGCRLVLQTQEMDTELDIVLEILARDAQDIKISEEAIETDAEALKFAQSAAGAYGGLDVVVNLARLDDAGLAQDASAEDIEDRLSATLGRSFRITQVIANRMQLTWREGLILNIVTQGVPETAAAAHLGRIARAALAALTRQEAQRFAGQAVRVNAIVPAAEESCAPDAFAPAGLGSEPEIAALALRLAGNSGKSLSGLLFDAALVARQR